MSQPAVLNPAKFPQSQWLADGAVLLVAIFWGSSFLVSKQALAVYPLFLFLFVRFSISCLLLIPISWRQLRQASRETWRIGTIFGSFLFGIFVLETLGVMYTSATNAGFIISLCVVLVPLIEGIIQKRFPSMLLLGAVLLSVLGTGLLTLKQGYHFNIGDVLILTAAVTRACFMIMTQRLTRGRQVDSAALNVVQLGSVAVMAGVVSFFSYPMENLLPHTGTLWVALLYLALFCTIYAFYVQLSFIRRTSPTRAGVLLGTEPLFAALFGVALGGEELSILGWVGGFCMVAGTFIGRYAEEKRSRNMVTEARDKR